MSLARAPLPDPSGPQRSEEHPSPLTKRQPALRLVPTQPSRSGPPRPPAAAAPAAMAPARADAGAEGAPEPPSEAAIQRLALLAFEVIEGDRPVAQLGNLVSPRVIEELRRRRTARIERRTLLDDRRRTVPRPGKPHSYRPSSLAFESAVVLQAEARAVAVALRFEISRGRWQIVHLTVL